MVKNAAEFVIMKVSIGGTAKYATLDPYSKKASYLF